MNWRGSLWKRVRHPGHFPVRNVLDMHVLISILRLLWTQNSDLSSHGLDALEIPSGNTSSSLILCWIHIHQCRVEVETDRLMIRTLLVADTGGRPGEQARGNISKSLTFIHVTTVLIEVDAGPNNRPP